jgi:FAD/FMN-containing dehydrogenase
VRPQLAESTASAAARTPAPAAVAALGATLTAELGPAGVATDEMARRAASADFSYLSPVLSAALPRRVADLVARPASPDEIATVVALAARYRVPVTARGRGTGDSGQAVPLAGGLVVDTSRADAVLGVGTGWVQAAAGATFTKVEAAVRQSGQELALMPTTVGSTLAGFVAGGTGGLGSIENGLLPDGFVVSLEVCGPETGVETVEGPDCRPVLGGYGVSGVITTVTVRLVPARTWVALLVSAGSWKDAVDVARALVRLTPAPRLVSLDEPNLVATYPANDAMPAGRYSLRAIVADSTVDAAARAASDAGCRVEAVRPEAVGYLTSLGFDHVVLRARSGRPGLAHLRVGGPALIDRADDVRAALPGALLHLDAVRDGFAGLLLIPFSGVDALYDSAERLRALGVTVVDPHSWLVDGDALAAIRERAARVDPAGLLNPGKLLA